MIVEDTTDGFTRGNRQDINMASLSSSIEHLVAVVIINPDTTSEFFTPGRIFSIGSRSRELAQNKLFCTR